MCPLDVLCPGRRLRPFPEREPLLGWYPEGEAAVMERHLWWMKEYGIDFVAFDWYWTQTNEHFSIIPLTRTCRPPIGKTFRLLSCGQITLRFRITLTVGKMVRYWIVHYLKRDEYLKFNDQPVVFVFDPQRLETNAQKFGRSSMNLLGRPRKWPTTGIVRHLFRRLCKS